MYNNNYLQIFARGFHANGGNRINQFQVNTTATGQHGKPAVGMDSDGDFAIVWGSSQILGRGFNPNGTQRKADFTVNSDSSGQQFVPAAAIDEENRFVFTWQDDMDGDGLPLVFLRNLKF